MIFPPDKLYLLIWSHLTPLHPQQTMLLQPPASGSAWILQQGGSLEMFYTAYPSVKHWRALLGHIASLNMTAPVIAQTAGECSSCTHWRKDMVCWCCFFIFLFFVNICSLVLASSN